jgi:DNA-binding NarL/FixJ family response regulator
MAANKRILDVGQCGVDGPRLKRYLVRGFQCAVDQASTKEEALSRVAGEAGYDLVLVNRILASDRSEGLEVIRALRAAHPEVRMMLVSDRREAQEEACRCGALRGFGKAALDARETEEAICAALGGC